MPMWVNKRGITKGFITFFLIVVMCLSTAMVKVPDSQQQYSAIQSLSACLYRLNIRADDLHWADIPTSVDQLHTEMNYFFLAGQLIKNRIVNANGCPSGGLALNDDYANACGMSVAKPSVIHIQNMVNEPILQAWSDVGVPPVLLKQLISRESQFWPSNHAVLHFGFGHVTYIGILNALYWNPDLYTEFCSTSAVGNCTTREGVAYQILLSLDASCVGCEYGIHPAAADKSVHILAQVLLGYCYQAEQLVYNATGWNPIQAVDYGTMWKLTLMNYNAGPDCVYKAVTEAFKTTQGPVGWADIVAHTTGDQCIRGLYYAIDITAKHFY